MDQGIVHSAKRVFFMHRAPLALGIKCWVRQADPTLLELIGRRRKGKNQVGFLGSGNTAEGITG